MLRKMLVALAVFSFAAVAPAEARRHHHRHAAHKSSASSRTGKPTGGALDTKNAPGAAGTSGSK